MQVPLIGNEDTSKALHEWESQQIKPQELPQHVQKNMEKAQAAVAQRQALEEAVAPCKPANEELLAAYMAYIQLEQVLAAAPRHASTPGMAQDNLGHFSGYMPPPLSSATRSCNASEDKYNSLQGCSNHRSVRTLCRSRGSRLVSWYSMSGRWLCSQSRIFCGSSTQHICRVALKCTVS